MTINSELVVTVQQSVDGKQYKLVGLQHVPYASSAEYLSLIPGTRRHIGQFGYIANGPVVEVWQFLGGVADINFVKVGTGSIANNAEIVPITAESTKAISWTATRAALFGVFPITEVWLSDGVAYAKAAFEPTIDAPPPSFTVMNFDFGGLVTGFIIIK